MAQEDSSQVLSNEELLALVMTEALDFRPKGRKVAYRGILEKGLVTVDGHLTNQGFRLLYDLNNGRSANLAHVRRQALIEGLRLYGPTQYALLVLGGFSAAAGISHTETIHSKVQQALLRRGLLTADGALTPLGKKAAEAVLKERQLNRR